MSFQRSNAIATIHIDITSLVCAFIGGKSNFGLLIKEADESTLKTFRGFASNDSTGGNHPTLIIDYTIPTTGKKQVEFVGSGSTAYQVGTTVITPELPQGVKLGDLMVLCS